MLKLLHILLSFLVYISSMGLVVNSHYCQERLKGVSIFVQPENCHSKKEGPVCPFHQKAMATDTGENNCCHNKSHLVKEDPETVAQVYDIANPPMLFLALIPQIPSLLSAQVIHSGAATYLNYKPPIVERDISVLFETFLI
ncbi:MAG: hypothetical protein KDC34_05955 [Saprospiraceae bacterium]|nr:hypothetical protein [Saprospiraceae bacterium]